MSGSGPRKVASASGFRVSFVTGTKINVTPNKISPEHQHPQDRTERPSCIANSSTNPETLKMASYTYQFINDEDVDEKRLGCKCCRFESGTDLPIPKKLEVEEVKELALGFSTRILKDWTKLNAVLKRFEGTY